MGAEEHFHQVIAPRKFLVHIGTEVKKVNNKNTIEIAI